MKIKFLLFLFSIIIKNFYSILDIKSDNKQSDNSNLEIKPNIIKGAEYAIIYASMVGGLIIFKAILDEAFNLLSSKNRKSIKKIMFADIGGYNKIKTELLNLVNETKNPENQDSNMTCILLHGPPGTGKTYLALALSNETGLNFVSLDSTHIFSSPYVGESEAEVKKIFTKAKKTAPCIIFIDEADVFFSDTAGNTPIAKLENNIKKLFLTHMDGNYDMKGVILIACTNHIENISPAFLRSGRFEHKIFMNFPSYEDRLEMVKINLKKYMIIVEDTINIETMAKETNNLNAADINTLFKQIKKVLKENKKRLLNEEIFITSIKDIKLSKLNALNKTTTPKKIYFSNIGGYTKVKEELLEIVDEAKNTENKNTNMTCILLHGPPGTGKTYIAQALANESNLPIIILDSTDILSSPYIGESEKQLKLILEQAKTNSPCIIFIDEIDALLSHRNKKHNSNTDNNIKNLLLSYIDGLHEMNGIILIGATNNMSEIDPAFLRSGRFEHKFFIDIPTYEDRLDIISINLNKNELNINEKINIAYMAKETESLNSADLNALFKNIKKSINKKNRKNSSNIIKKQYITMKIFNTELEKIKAITMGALKKKQSGKSPIFSEIKNNILPMIEKIFDIQ